MDKLFLIDGHALVFKMYYAFLRRPMINSKGADMSILFGFTKYLLELIQREKPTHLAVAFDPPGGTFRNQMYPEYKGTRPPTPQLIIDALEPLTGLVEAMGIPVVMVPGFEADDVLGSITVQNASETLDVYMVTPDKDYGQLVGPHAFQYKPGKSGADNEIVGVKELCEKWGIQSPSQVIDMLAICGDTADNVPGVKGVGEVGAAKLIAQYGSLENIYAHLDQLSPRQQELFREAQPHMALSKALVTIKTDMSLPVTLEQMRYSGAFTPRLAELFQEYEFTSLKKYLAGTKTPVSVPEPAQNGLAGTKTPVSVPEPKLVTFDAMAALHPTRLGIVTEAWGEGLTSIKRIMVSHEGQVCVIPGDHIPSALRNLLESPDVDKYGSDLKRQARLLHAAGIHLQGKWWDIQLMHYVLNPERSHDLAALAQSLLLSLIHI